MDRFWQIQLFGALRAQHGGRVVTRFRSHQTGALLAYLALHPGRSHPREALIELFWPEAAEASARHSLSMALSSLRHQLEPPGVPSGAVIVADRLSVQLSPGAFASDVEQFEDTLRAAARAPTSGERLQLLLEAIGLVRGPLLPGYYDDWLLREQDRISGRHLDALRHAAELLAARGDRARALELCRRAVANDPTHEESHLALIRLLHEGGDDGAALRQYRELERVLDEELDARPSPGARALAQQILQAPVAARPRPTPPAPVDPPSPSRILSGGTVTLSAFLYSPEPQELSRQVAPALRGVAEQYGGTALGSDPASEVFAHLSASAGLEAAVTALRKVAEELGEEAEALLVRAALHTADLRSERDREAALHIVRRLAAAAHGGQILCSRSTAALFHDDEGSQLRVRELGEFRVRGLGGAPRLFELEYPGGSEGPGGPVPAEASSTRRGLPATLTRFFGRDSEITRIHELLSPVFPGPDRSGPLAARLVTLLGPGGAGKTRLALEAGRSLAASIAGDVWFVPLAEVRDPAQIGGEILQALGVQPENAVPPLEQVVSVLRKRPTLLVLDNFEQLVEGGAEAVSSLLTQVPTLVCLVTSRRPLALEGEREVVVPPLAVPGREADPERLSQYDSVRLFVDRAQSVKPDFRVTNQNAPAVAALCVGVEGLPLALELAAARAQVFSPSQMLRQLENRFGFLMTRKRGVAARHRSLRATLDWSFDLLPPELQRFLTRLSVFRGGWTVEAAEAVCAEPMALDRLADLQESSLVVADERRDGVRFRLLETVREYLWGTLDEAARESCHAAHAGYFVSLAEATWPALSGPDQAAALENLAAEHENFRGALEWCLETTDRGDLALRLSSDLRIYWSCRGHLREGRRYLSRALAQPESAGMAPHRTRALHNAGILARDLGDLADARDLLEQALARRREENDDRGAAASAVTLGLVAYEQGEYAVARTLYGEGLEFYRRLADRSPVDGSGLVKVLSNLGRLCHREADYPAAMEYHEEALLVAEGMGDPLETAGVLNNIGTVVLDQGDPAGARPYFERCAAAAREVGDRFCLAIAVLNLGEAARRIGDFGQARELLGDAVIVAQQDGVTAILFGILEQYALLADSEGDAGGAVKLLTALDALRLAAGFSSLAAECPITWRRVSALREKLDTAVFFREAGAGKRLTLAEALAFAASRAANDPPGGALE